MIVYHSLSQYFSPSAGEITYSTKRSEQNDVISRKRKRDFRIVCSLLDKSGVGIVVDYSRDYTVVNGVQCFFQFFFSFNLRYYKFQSAKKREMTSFSMTQLQIDERGCQMC